MNKIKNIIAALLSAAYISVISVPVFAQSLSYSEFAAQTENNITESDTPEIEKDTKPQRSINYENYQKLAGYIEELYIDDSITEQEAMERGLSDYLDQNEEALWDLLKAMFRSLDPWSEFFVGNEYQEYENTINRTFYGIGVAIRESGGYVEITGFSEENSLAERTGFKVGDKFVKVAGVDCVGKSTDAVRTLIVGDLGTTVDITVLRNGEYVNLTATRTEVKTATVTNGILHDNIGYIKISSFGENTAAEMAAALDQLKEQGVKKYILDLRNNGGGRLDAAVEIAQMIVPKGKIIDVVYREKEKSTSYYSDLTTKDFDMVTLVNEHTASSSEILASAIQDSGAGRLVGSNTYGKAVIQQVYPLRSGYMYFKLTIGEYKTRNGNAINYVGLQPDEAVENKTQAIDTTKYTPFDFRTRQSLGDMGANILAAKEKLFLLNQYNGNTSDSIFNQELRDTLKSFQRSVGIADSGVLDVVTQVKLEEEFEKLKTVVDVQLQTAYEMLGGDPEMLYAK